MSIIGQYADLKVAKLVDFGVYLEGENEELILLPSQYVPEKTQIDDTISVFVYRDSEDRVIATTLKPIATVGQFAPMKVKAVSRVGAFLDWGLAKDLLVPFSEQNEKMSEGNIYLVYVYLDSVTGRIVGTAKIERILHDKEHNHNEGDKINIIVGKRTELGYQVLIEDDALGMIYKNEVFGHLKTGDKRVAYIKKIRPDGKIDVSLQQQGYEKEIPNSGQQILEMLKAEEGFLPVNDKSSPEDIYYLLNMSKKNFKKAIGMLYKQRLITIEENGIYLKNK